jgi:hypothetical protein
MKKIEKKTVKDKFFYLYLGIIAKNIRKTLNLFGHYSQILNKRLTQHIICLKNGICAAISECGRTHALTSPIVTKTWYTER